MNDFMNIIENYKVPTGNIIILNGEYGKLEMLSLGDYGKDVNLNQNKEVKNSNKLLPLSEKWVITISTQYGCSMNCNFCDVPKVGKGLNATLLDLNSMILIAQTLKNSPSKTNRMNIHFARMGEPTFNKNVIDCAYSIMKIYGDTMNPHPVVSTMMPNKNKNLKKFIDKWMIIKNDVYKGNAGLQLSINSTSEYERNKIFSGNSLKLHEISEIVKNIKPKVRKITLNFAVADYTVNTDYLSNLFSPDKFIIKITPMHKTKTAIENKIKTKGKYTSPTPYQELEKKFKKSGFETLVFIASKNEDLGRITCGNAILSGTRPEVRYKKMSLQTVRR